MTLFRPLTPPTSQGTNVPEIKHLVSTVRSPKPPSSPAGESNVSSFFGRRRAGVVNETQASSINLNPKEARTKATIGECTVVF